MNNPAIHPTINDRGDALFSVWAPHANSVTLIDVDNGTEHAMIDSDRGYWNLTLTNIDNGFRYKYQLDDNAPLPDPASMHQPDGVFGPSALVDPKKFKWTDHTWKGIPLENLIIYEIHPGTFTAKGTFEGIGERLEYLKELGVNAIEIMPVAQFSGSRNWGYDGVFPFAVQNSYGGPDRLAQLVDKCHAQGISVILDVVYNHLGPEGNVLPQFGSYYSDSYATPWGKPLNFDAAYSDEVRKYFIQNALMWLRDFHIDGLRLDAVHAIYDLGASHFLADLAKEVAELEKREDRQYLLIAESNLNDIKFISTPETGGYGLHAQWSDDFHHALHSLISGEISGYYSDFGKMHHLIKALEKAFVYDGNYSIHRKKSYGNSTHAIPRSKFVVFTQNHDQVGNRKNGERLIALSSFEMAKIAAGMLLLSPYTPMLFMGEEYAESAPFLYFVDHSDAALQEAVKRGRKQEFADFFDDGSSTPDPNSPETFLKSKLSWNIEKSELKKAMFSLYKSLIDLRQKHPAFKNCAAGTQHIENFGDLLMVHRWNLDQHIVGLYNFGQNDGKAIIPPDLCGELYRIIDSSSEMFGGVGASGPEQIVANEQVSLPGHTFTMYSTTR